VKNDCFVIEVNSVVGFAEEIVETRKGIEEEWIALERRLMFLSFVVVAAAAAIAVVENSERSSIGQQKMEKNWENAKIWKRIV